MEFEGYGEKIDSIPVKLNYRIIELFSAGLYSSPNKAFEELVSNSYDANAKKVYVHLPDEIKDVSKVLVFDNGDSMNSQELKELWQIGTSTKREKEKSGKTKRLQIGQFGIGKLATYVLARKLTYLCKKEGKIRLVTMNYDAIPKYDKQELLDLKKGEDLSLDEIDLKEEKAKELFEKIKKSVSLKKMNFNLFGKNAEPTWTLVILSNLRDRSRGIKQGRLAWLLSTALPVNPNFKLSLNGEDIKPKKEDGRIIKEWIIGKDDKVAEREGYPCKEKDGEYFVDLPNLKNIHGKITLYEDSLATGKATRLGRSHGIFLMVRKRLINTSNPLLNDMEELNHATFNRIRFEIHANKLDKELTSPRETIKSSLAYQDLITYINQKFNKAKSTFDKWCTENYSEQDFSDKMSNATPFFSKVPVYTTVKKFFDNKIDNLYLINIPENLSREEKISLLDELDKSITDPKIRVMEDYSLNNDLTLNDPIAKLNLKERKIDINTHHPFYISFLSELKGKSGLPFSLIAANEVLTEASLIERGVDQVDIREILERRDSLFREFSKRKKPDLLMAVMMLKNSLSDEKGLEEALHACFDCLGFKVTPMAKRGTPEGKAIAKLGIWDGKKQDYSFTYEAKSTSKNKISAADAKTNIVNRHRVKNKADFALEVAIDYQGSTKSDSAINELAVADNVTVARARDFWKLMINSIPNQLTLLKFKEFLSECRTVIDSEKWIENFSNQKIEKKPYKEVLEGIWDIQDKDPRESPTIEALRYNANLKQYTVPELREMINTLVLLRPDLVHLDQNKVRILLPPEKILESLNKLIEDQAPPEFKEKFREVFESNLDKD